MNVILQVKGVRPKKKKKEGTEKAALTFAGSVGTHRLTGPLASVLTIVCTILSAVPGLRLPVTRASTWKPSVTQRPNCWTSANVMFSRAANWSAMVKPSLTNSRL